MTELETETTPWQRICHVFEEADRIALLAKIRRERKGVTEAEAFQWAVKTHKRYTEQEASE